MSANKNSLQYGRKMFAFRKKYFYGEFFEENTPKLKNLVPVPLYRPVRNSRPVPDRTGRLPLPVPSLRWAVFKDD